MLRLRAWAWGICKSWKFSGATCTPADAIERAAADLNENHMRGLVLELAVVPTFATQWLLPRLKHFQTLHPQITVNLTNRTRPFLFADTEFDAAIYFGDGDWSGTQAHFLMHEQAVPVCSPARTSTHSST